MVIAICPLGCFLPRASGNPLSQRAGLYCLPVFTLLSRLLCTGVFCLSFAHPALALSSISIEAATVETADTQLRNLRAEVKLPAAEYLQLHLAGEIKSAADSSQAPAPTSAKSEAGHSWQTASLECSALVQKAMPAGQQEWQCAQGLVNLQGAKLPFSLSLQQQNSGYQLALQLQGASFSDAAGSHAGENLHLQATLNLKPDVAAPAKAVSAKSVQAQARPGWQWQIRLDWQQGELYWQPWYIASGGHTLQASGHYAGDTLSVTQAALNLDKVGQASASGLWQGGKIQTLHVDAPDLALAPLYSLLLQPMLADSALNKLELAGQAGLSLHIEHGEPVSALLSLKQVDMEDQQGRFALYKLNAHIPWEYDAARQVQLNYAGGHLLKIPLGETSVLAELNRYSLTTPQLYLPILDGALSLTDVSATQAGGQWHWHLRANLVPISMPALSHALGWPRMEGKVAAAIPMVTYSAGNLTTNGDLLFQMFNGNILVKGLRMQTPLGSAARLQANLEMQRLDLGDLTRTFSFGAIEGKLDGAVNDLELSNWQPVAFDADFHSSPGKYRKKISQRAVENISALGGAGAVAAIQRSVLRFFDEFNYADLGWRCQLRNDICSMSGVEYSGPGYVIVKGSGVPAITVMGYNHKVGWSDLITRLKRVTEGNSSPVIK